MRKSDVFVSLLLIITFGFSSTFPVQYVIGAPGDGPEETYFIDQDADSPEVTGFDVSIHGTASSSKAVGNCVDDPSEGPPANAQHISIDWDLDMDGDPDTGDGWQQLEDYTDWIFTCADEPGPPPRTTFEGTWATSTTYTEPGTYTIHVIVHHGPASGAEASDSATITVGPITI